MVTVLHTTKGPIERSHHPTIAHNGEWPICSICEQGWPCEVAQLLAEVGRYRPIADAANRVAELISILGPEGREYVQFTESEPAERVEAVRALWAALEDY